jgi:predicted metalloendopeptidase
MRAPVHWWSYDNELVSGPLCSGAYDVHAIKKRTRLRHNSRRVVTCLVGWVVVMAVVSVVWLLPHNSATSSNSSVASQFGSVESNVGADVRLTNDTTTIDESDDSIAVEAKDAHNVSSVVCSELGGDDVVGDDKSEHVDNGIDACDNLALHVNNGWVAGAYDGQDRSFSLMETANSKMLYHIFEVERDRQWGEQGVGVLHQYMRACEHSHEHEDVAEAALLCPHTRTIMAAQNTSQLVVLLGEMSREGAVVPFYFNMETSRDGGRAPLIYLEQDGVFASDERVFRSQAHREEHLRTLRRVLGVLKDTCGLDVDVSVAADDAHVVEDALRAAHTGSAADDIVGYVLHTGGYHKDVVTPQQAEGYLGSSFSMRSFLTGFMPDNSEWVRQSMQRDVWMYRREFFDKFKELWARALSITAWQSYLLCALIISRMGYMPKRFPEVRETVAQKMQHDTQNEIFRPLLREDNSKLHLTSGGGARARSHATPWKRRNMVSDKRLVHTSGNVPSTSSMPECLWHAWHHASPQVSRWFAQARAPLRAREHIMHIVEDVRETMIDMLKLASGVNPKHMEKQIQKLRNVVIKVGVPNTGFPVDVSRLRLSPTSFHRNALTMDRWRRATQTAELVRDVVDRDGPFMDGVSLTEVNAFYNPQANSISVLAGLFLPPFYSLGYTDTRLMAGIGMVIGHELAHAVDYTGIYWDHEGNLDADFATDAFVMDSWARTRCVRRQYTDITRMGNVQDGTVTVAEDYSDIFGTKAALETALKRANLTDALSDKPRRDSLVREFFTHYARNWMVAYTKESEAAVIASDVHSVAEVRINNVFANSKRALRAFGCRGVPVCPDVP